ncbi:YaaC family protein [Actinomadura bangladeshensis]|uniref:Uncharacterized protein n=1 Tax=Actinomadura bangladeshensis TaxID=453573 RepID=A0A4R4P5P5_9ACTN|nr:YaaC family protein [Actinomadura bangladeshensis]TDC16100.1 hypothetical protein E1284_13695 [Actinomadura bangladeshensis]
MSSNPIWRDLRALRSEPPNSVSTDSKKKIFSASLEQSEQYFRAAEEVGYETRPVLAFYGLSQMGRAIAAATHRDRHSSPNDWQLSGHGIRVPGISQLASGIGTLVVRDQGKGSFTQLAHLLRSPSLTKGTTLASVWNSIPEASGHNLPGGDDHPALWLNEGSDKTRNDWGDFGPPSVIILDGVPENIPSLVKFMARYPAIWPPDGMPQYRHERPLRHGPHGQVYISSLHEYVHGGFVTMHGFPYRGKLVALPTVSDNDAAMHPILSWWAVLFALSMLARYEPATWAAAINVDGSRDAVPIENLLDEVTSTIPSLAFDAICEYSKSDNDIRTSLLEKEEKCRRDGVVISWRKARSSMERILRKDSRGKIAD